ncbi:hypothetical protein I4U23_004794 [Adineta vaga]|nr:hypothetical protein I4U23_004794 [Adineta vaga]
MAQSSRDECTRSFLIKLSTTTIEQSKVGQQEALIEVSQRAADTTETKPDSNSSLADTDDPGDGDNTKLSLPQVQMIQFYLKVVVNQINILQERLLRKQEKR